MRDRDVTEIRRRVFKPDQVFPCRVLAGKNDYVVLLHVLDRPHQVADTPIPAGSMTVAHYVQGWCSVWWELYHADGAPLADLIHLTSRVQLREDAVEYTDLLLDVFQPAGGEAVLLDEDELAEAVAAGLLDDQTAAEVTELGRAILADMRGHWPPLWHQVDPVR
jgi:hypothetical protein